MALDKIRVNKELKFICENIKKLEILNRLEEEVFFKDFKNIDSTKYIFLETINSVLDLFNYIIVSKELDLPENLERTFIVLKENNLIGDIEFEEYLDLVRLRDRILFNYINIDDESIFKELKGTILKLKNIKRHLELLK